MNTYYNSTNTKEKLSISLVDTNKFITKASDSLDAVSIESDKKVNRNKFNESELIETVQAERKATLKEACRRLRDRRVCPSKIKHKSDNLLYSRNYKVCFLLYIT